MSVKDIPLRVTAVLCLVPLLLSGCAEKKQPQKRSPVPVITAQATRKTVPVQFTAVGNVESIQSVVVRPQVNGEILKVHFREGDDVAKGTLLFTIDPRPLEAALKKAQANLTRDLVQERNAKADAARYEQLVKEGIVTHEQYEGYRTKAEAATADAAADHANVENARVQLSYCTVRSPITGRTGNLTITAGNVVKANEGQLVTVNQIAPIYVTFSVPEKSLTELRSRMNAGDLRIEAVVPGRPEPEQGVVTFIDNTVDTTTGTIKLKGTFANKTKSLWPGQFATVVITLKNLPDAVVVPSQTVQTGQQGAFVFVVKPDSTADIRPVKTGVTYDGMTVIESGLQPGETVVTDGQMRLSPGAQVTVKQNAVSGERKAVNGQNLQKQSIPAGTAKP